MVERVEERLDVGLDEPDRAGPGVLDLVERGVAGTPGTEPVRTVTEHRLIDTLQQERDGSLYQLVVPSGDPERASAVGLGDVDAARGREPIRAGHDPVDDRLQPLAGEPVQRRAVGTGSRIA